MYASLIAHTRRATVQDASRKRIRQLVKNKHIVRRIAAQYKALYDGDAMTSLNRLEAARKRLYNALNADRTTKP